MFYLHLCPLGLAQYLVHDRYPQEQDGEHRVNNRIRQLCCTGYSISGGLEMGKMEGLGYCHGLAFLSVSRIAP